jgi:hypothetical protein
MLVSLLAARQLPTSGGAVGAGIFHPASDRVLMTGRFVAALFRAAKAKKRPVMPDTALSSGKAPPREDDR